MTSKPILVTGATGYVGGRLAPLLLERGWRVRAMARNVSKLKGRAWTGHPNCEIVAADVLDGESMVRAAEGCGAAFYLVHSMNPKSGNFADADRIAALNTRDAAAVAGMERIVYLGGLGDDDEHLSKHLKSRLEVARILQSGPAPVTFLRAAMILGSGSASFEILRYLTDRLPVMTTPTWVHNPVQPIAIRNVINYLVGCLEHEETAGRTYEIGGPDVLTYRELMEIYAEEARIPKPRILPVPVLSPRLSAYWIHLVTPVHSSIAMPLAEGLRNPVVCKDFRIRDIIPQELLSCRLAIRYALERIHQERVDTCWMDAGNVCRPEWLQEGDAPYAGGTVLKCCYRIVLKAAPEEVWDVVGRIGGDTGWYFADYLWSLRGWMDTLSGGVGVRRGRRHPSEINAGDALDFWRVLEVEPPRRLLLLAEMKLPGEALLEFRIEPKEDGSTELQQISRFLPRGLMGMIYWYSLYPFHHPLYRGMLRSIARKVNKPVIEGPEPFDPGKKNRR